jgi:uncharacterized protein YdeI (YjbR/CyaY-like superfamily)
MPPAKPAKPKPATPAKPAAPTKPAKSKPAARPAKPEIALLELPDQSAWEQWLEANHDSDQGVWLKFAKKGAPDKTITYPEAVEGALMYGWIDGQAGSIDQHYWRQRFTRRGPRSKWSQINCQKATALIDAGRMRPPGLEQVEKAKEDGRWDNAYAPQSRITVPEDLQQALDANPEAKAFFETLSSQNRYAILFRLHDAKRPETRKKRIKQFVEMLAERKTFHP